MASTSTKSGAPTAPRGKGAWELYSTDPKSGEAARALTTAIVEVRKEITRATREAIRNHRRWTSETASELLWFAHPNHSAFCREVGRAHYESCKRHLYPVMERYAHQGAWDTEPRAVANWYIRKCLEATFGVGYSAWYSVID